MAPVLEKNVVYADMADNLNKCQFDVLVKESYVPRTHYAFLGDGAPPPVREIPEWMAEDVCKAGLSLTYIIDALCGGHWLEFEHSEDMDVAKNWIELYLTQYKDIDISKYPERVAFNKNAERALNMLKGNLRRRDEYEASKNPRKLDVEDILSML